jgi:YesN/AraC family two-component response regulator
MPIMKNDILVGYVIMGRMRTPDSSYRYTPSANLESLFEEAPLFTYEKIDCLKDLLPQILFENAIEIEQDSLSLQITNYIQEHLSEPLSIDFICSHFHISKDTLYATFHTELHCTVNAYITEQRIKKAKRLLSETSEPIYRIAYMVGIDNYTYFCKLFKRKVGMTPDTYRKQLSL